MFHFFLILEIRSGECVMEFWTLIAAVKFFAMMTSFKGDTVGLKFAWCRNLIN